MLTPLILDVSSGTRGAGLGLCLVGFRPPTVQSESKGQAVQRGDPIDPNHRFSPKPHAFPPLAEVSHGQKKDATRPGETQHLKPAEVSDLTATVPFDIQRKLPYCDGFGLFTANCWRSFRNSHVIARMLVSSR